MCNIDNNFMKFQEIFIKKKSSADLEMSRKIMIKEFLSYFFTIYKDKKVIFYILEISINF